MGNGYQHIAGLKPISLQAAVAYASGFGCTLADISPAMAAEIDKAKRVTGNVEPNVVEYIPVIGLHKCFPIISWVQAGMWSEIVDQFPRGSADEYFYTVNSHGPHTFALRVVGDSMEPEYREGDIILVDPDVSPRPGDAVVARNHHEEATFKKYRSRGRDADGNDVFELVPLNADYATIRSDEEPIRIIGVVVQHTRMRKP